MRDQKDRELSIPNFFFLPPWNSSSTCGRAFPRTKRRTKRRMANWSDRGLRPRARFDFLPGLGMRAHLRQIVNTFIHVRQPRVLYSVVALDNETGAFWPFSRRRIARNTRVAQRDVSPTKIYFIVETTISQLCILVSKNRSNVYSSSNMYWFQYLYVVPNSIHFYHISNKQEILPL